MGEQRAWNGLSTIHFYLREGYFGSALSECEKRLIESNEPRLVVLRGLTLVFMERRSEGLRLLEGAKEGLCSLGALYALRVAYARTAKADKESQRMVEAEIAKGQKEASTEAIISSIEVLLLSGSTNGVRPLLEKLLTTTGGGNPQVITLMGWLDMSSGGNMSTAQKAFEKAAGMGYPDAYLGRVQIYEKRRATPEMRVVAKELSTSNVRLIPAHIVSVKAEIADREWESAGQTAANALLIQEDSVYLLFLRAVHAIVYKGSEMEETTSSLSAHFDKIEKGNGPLAFSYAQFFTRIALKNGSVTKLARKMLERAMSATPSLLVHDILAFRLFVALGDEREAVNRAKQLMKAESDHPYALLSMVMCSLMSGNVRDAQSHLSFVQEAHGKIKNTPLFHFLNAVCIKHTPSSRSFEEFVAAMKRAIDEQLASVQGVAYGIDGIFTLDVDFLVGIVYQLMDFAPVHPVRTNPILKEIERVLSCINDYCPGLLEVNYLLARVKWLLSQSDAAERIVDELTRGSDATAQIFLLKAQIKIEKGRIEEAESALDTGLSQSFAVRDSPLFHLIKVKVLKKRNDHERAVDTLRKIIGEKSKEEVGMNALARRERDDGHRVSLYLELIDSLQTMGRMREADQVMEEALSRWTGTHQEEELIVMNSRLLVGKGDADGALLLLSSVKQSQISFQAARLMMAQIYLEEKKDKTMYTKIFKELIQNEGSPTHFALLGDAYMRVQKPKKAIEVYEKALKANPKDHALAAKIGEAYVQCHLYTKAVNYYEAALKTGRDSGMRIKLANLLCKMGNYDKCERVLSDPVNKERQPTELGTMMTYVQYYLLLAKVHHEKGFFEKVNEDLTEAKKLQMKIIQRTDGSMGLQMKRECALICAQMAEMHQLNRDIPKAIEAYKESVMYNDADIKTHLALAQTYLTSARHDLCSKECQVILSIDKNNIEAILMAADIMYSKNQLKDALLKFGQVLEHLPNNYHALSRFIELSWREGRFTTADNRLYLAMAYNPRATVDAGFNYCKGIHEWYSGNMNSALQFFNRARKDLEWGEKSIYNMVELLLNPENDIVGVNGDDPSEESTNSITAGRFLSELRADNSPDSKYAMHMAMIHMASLEKHKVQESLDKFLAIAIETVGGQEKVRNVGAVLWAARAYMTLKQTPKAKGLLKKVMDANWALADAHNLETCWLLLAEIYANQGKNDNAKALINKVLHVNKSSIKAYELMGIIFEKDSQYINAVYNYRMAWDFCRERIPSIGYKLAFNMLKARENFDCIIVCQQVLRLYPQYPKIRKELMEKARMNLRI